MHKQAAEAERRAREATATVAARQEEVEELKAKVSLSAKEAKAAKQSESNAVATAMRKVEDEVAEVRSCDGGGVLRRPHECAVCDLLRFGSKLAR